MNFERDTKPRFTPMTEAQIAAALEALQEMALEPMPKDKHDHLMVSIQSLKALQKIRAHQRRQAETKDG